MARKTKTGLLLTLDDAIEVEVEDYRDIQKAIGCDVFTSVPWLFDDEPACYVDDEGKINGSFPNRAVYTGGELVDILFGNILFLGFDPNSGESRDISEEEKGRVMDRFFSGNENVMSGTMEVLRMLSERDGR